MEAWFLTLIIWWPGAPYPELTFVNHIHKTIAACEETGENWLGELVAVINENQDAPIELKDVRDKVIGYFCSESGEEKGVIRRIPGEFAT